MTDNELADAVLSLISDCREGGYWDFKKQWPLGAELLHDIICMANNLEDRDAYIIMGVDEADGFAVIGVENDQGRRNTNDLTNFLRDKKFQGGMRPTALVQTLTLTGHQVDVVVVKNTSHTPYLVTEDFTEAPAGAKPRTVRANSIYTRVQDANTPIDKTADLDKIEYLWRKRFGIDKSALQRLDLFLDKPEDWQYDDRRSRFFHKYAPEFVIQIEDSYYQEDYEVREARKRSEFYCKLFPDSNGYHWEDFSVTYHQTVIYDDVCAYLDGGRHLIAIPDRKLIRATEDHITSGKYSILYYWDMSSINGKIHRLFVTQYPGDSDGLTLLRRSIVTFRDTSEKDAFVEYLCGSLPSLNGVQTLEQLEESHGGRGDGWAETVEKWQDQTMATFSDLLTKWRFTPMYTSRSW